MLLIPNAKMQFSVQTRKTCQKKVDVQPVLLDQMTTPSGWQDFYFCASLLERYFQCFFKLYVGQIQTHIVTL